MANVRDLLIRMSLDTATFKRNIADAKGELRTLKSEFKAVSSDSNVENAGGKLLENLREQKSTAEALVREYEKGIGEIKAKLDSVPAGSQAASQLQQQVTKLEDGLAKAKTSVNEIQTKIDTFKLDNLASAAEQVAGIFSSLRLGFGELLDGFGETADSADQVFVSREAAFTSATKNVEEAHQTQEDLDALNESLRQMSTQIPQTYEQLSALMGVGATLGVPYENLLEFTEVMAKLNTATNVDGESGAQAMAQFLNITEKGYGNLDRLGAVLTDLGNNSATTEQNILEMAHRAATGLSAVGMSAQDILALSAAINSVGIEAQAGGSSVSKLGITMDKAAKVGADAGGKLLAAWGDDEIKSVYDLYAALDQLGSAKGWRVMAENLGMNMADTKALMDSALAVERFSQAMGQTKEEFAAAWNADAATQMLNFFRALGSMEGTDESENMLWVMDQLGIKEIRQSNMVRALAGNWELYANMLGIARNAYDENIALENEAQRAFSTTESQRTMNRNKEQNALEAMGTTVAAMRKPWDDFFGDMQQWYADWPGWAQDAVAGATEVMGGLGSALDKAGKLSFSVSSIANAVKDLKQTGMGAKLLSGAASAGKYALGAAGAAAAGYGLYELGKYLADISDSSDNIADRLSGLKITVDPDSKDATLAAIAEVQRAAAELSGDEMEKYAGTSRVVQLGFGTSAMFGQALAYEQQKGEEAIAATYERYGRLIQEQEAAMLEAPDDAARQAIQSRIEALTTEMETEAQTRREELGRTLNAVINGAIQQTGADGDLENAARKYNVLNMVYEAWNKFQDDNQIDKLGQEIKGPLLRALSDFGFNTRQLNRSGIWGADDFKKMANFMFEQLSGDIEEVAGNGKLMGVLSAALSSGALDNADLSQMSGAFLSLLEVMDIKNASDKGVKDWRDLGQNSMLGLGQGIEENSGDAKTKAEAAAQGLIDAAKAVLQVQSPSQVFFDIGENIDLGLAQGIYSKAEEAIQAASWLAGQVEETMRGALDIQSPSRKMEVLGGYVAQGFARGIENGLARIEGAADRMAHVMERSSSGASRAMPTAGNGRGGAAFILSIDGKAFAQAIAPFVDDALGEAAWP